MRDFRFGSHNELLIQYFVIIISIIIVVISERYFELRSRTQSANPHTKSYKMTNLLKSHTKLPENIISPTNSYLF